MILSQVWDYSFDPGTNVVDVLVFRLREKIDRSFEPKLLHTVRASGSPQGGLIGSGTRWRLRLAIWYGVLFVSSALALVGITYLLLCAIRSKRGITS